MQPKEYTIPANELTKLLKAIKFYQISRIAENGIILQLDNYLDKEVNHFFHFNCGVKPENLTTEKVLSDKFKI